MYNRYIEALLSLRRKLDNKIDQEVEETMRGNGDSSRLKESLLYTIEDDFVLKGKFKGYESIEKDRN